MSVIQTLVDVQGPGFRDNLAHHAGQIALLRARLAEVATAFSVCPPDIGMTVQPSFSAP